MSGQDLLGKDGPKILRLKGSFQDWHLSGRTGLQSPTHTVLYGSPFQRCSL